MSEKKIEAPFSPFQGEMKPKVWFLQGVALLSEIYQRNPSKHPLSESSFLCRTLYSLHLLLSRYFSKDEKKKVQFPRNRVLVWETVHFSSFSLVLLLWTLETEMFFKY